MIESSILPCDKFYYFVMLIGFQLTFIILKVVQKYSLLLILQHI